MECWGGTWDFLLLDSTLPLELPAQPQSTILVSDSPLTVNEFYPLCREEDRERRIEYEEAA